MKLKYLASVFALATLVFSSCQEEEDLGIPRIVLEPSELTFSAGEDSNTISLTATRDWYINNKPSWVGFSAEKGKASSKEQQITVTVNANDGFDRTESIEFTTGYVKTFLSITQKGSNGEIKVGSGTKEDPYTVAGVLAYTKSLGKDIQSPDKVYFKGTVSSVSTTYEASGTYGNATFYVVDPGTTEPKFYCFQTLYLGNRKWKSGEADIKEGDEVTVCGYVVNFKGDTPETVSKGGSYVYSLNGKVEETGGDLPAGDPKGSGTQADPYNVAAAIKAASSLKWTSNTSYDKVGPYYIKGKVSEIDQDYTYNVSDGRSFGNARFNITDDGTTSSAAFKLYNLNYLGDNKFKAGQTDIKVGDDVIIYAEIMNYHNDTPENSGGYLYSLNGNTGESQPSETITGTVAQTIAAADGAAVVIPEAQVAAISGQGVVVTDQTGNVYLFFDAKAGETVPSVKIGDKVKVEAVKDTYGGVPEFKKASLSVLSAGTISYPAPKDITSIAATYESNVTEFVKLSGTLIISGNYYNIEIDGVNSDSKMGSISAPLESLDAKSYEGKKITVTGYFSGLTGSGGKYINIVATEIAPADPNAKYCTVEPSSVNVKADATSAEFSIKANAAWTAVSDNAAFTLEPASGGGDATVKVSFSANEGEAARVANIKVSCPDAGVEATVVITQSKPSSGESVVITADFTKVDANLPQGSSEGQKEGTYTVDGYTFTFHAADKYYQAKSGDNYYLLIGKANSYVEFPKVDGKALTKIEFLTGAGASENVIGDIAKADGTRLNVNDDKLKKGTKYEWTIAGEPGAAYRFLVTNNYNAQFQNITLTYE